MREAIECWLAPRRGDEAGEEADLRELELSSAAPPCPPIPCFARMLLDVEPAERLPGRPLLRLRGQGSRARH